MTIEDGHTIGKRIRALRGQTLTLSGLADEVGVSKGYLSQLETGRVARPSAEVLSNLATALGVSLLHLLGEHENEYDGGGRELPPGLGDFIAERDSKGTSLPREDVNMLQKIRHHGRQPDSVDDWRFIYEAIERVIG